MKKLILTVMAVMMAVSATVFAKEAEGKDKILYIVEMHVKMPVGEITQKGLVYTRKDLEFRGVIEATTGYLVKSNKDDFSSAPKIVTVKWHWMSQESFRLYEPQAIEVNEYNRHMGRSGRLFSYLSTLDVTSSFSAIGESKTAGGVCWQFTVPRYVTRVTPVAEEALKLSMGHFGFGLDSVTVVLSGIAKGSNGYLEEAEGVVTLVSTGLLSDAVNSITVFNGLQQLNHVKNVMRPNGVGTFKMHRIQWSKSFKEDVEQYFYDKYDYSDVEVLDRLKR